MTFNEAIKRGTPLNQAEFNAVLAEVTQASFARIYDGSNIDYIRAIERKLYLASEKRKNV